MENIKKNIVIIGGGFGGVSTAEALSKYKSVKERYNLIVVNATPYLLFTPTLYELVIEEEPIENISLELKDIFLNKDIKLIIQEAISIDSNKRQIFLKDGTIIDYAFLVMSVGTKVNDRGIKNLNEYSYFFKTVDDGIKIQKDINTFIKRDKELKIVVGGAGYNGVEISAELALYVEELCKNYNYPREKVKITLISTSQSLFKDMKDEVNLLVESKLKKCGVEIIRNERVYELQKKKIYFNDKSSLPYDMFIWTGGVKGASIIKNSLFKKEDYAPEDKIYVDKYLRICDCDELFACGDCTIIRDTPTPTQCEIAIDEGKIIAYNINAIIERKALKVYEPHLTGIIIPLSENYSYADLGFMSIKGFLANFLQKLVYLKFLVEVLPIDKAISKWLLYMKYLYLK